MSVHHPNLGASNHGTVFLAPTTLSWLGRFWELSDTCTSAVGLCVSPSTPMEFEQCEKLGWGCRGCYQVLALPRPGGCSVASPSSPKFLLSGFSPSGIGHLSTQSARGISPWDFPRSTGQFLSPSQPTLLHPRVPHQPVWPPYKILLSPLLSSSSFFFPTFQFISCSPTAAFAGLFHQVDH